MSVTLDELKNHLRITWSDEDDLLAVYLSAAIVYLSEYTGREISQSARVSYFDRFGRMELTGDNPSSVTVEYVDPDGDTQTLSSSIYAIKVHKAKPYITLAYDQCWPEIRHIDAAITVSYTSGYTDSTLPGALKAAVLIEAATQYEFRENESIVKLQNRKTVERLSAPYRLFNL